jgi:hypothetical protein
MKRFITKSSIKFNNLGSISDLISILKAKVVKDNKEAIKLNREITAYISGYPPPKAK